MGECDDVSAASADRVSEIATQPASTRWIGDILRPEDAESGCSGLEKDHLTDDWIDETLNVSPTDSVTVSVSGDKTPPRPVSTPLEDETMRLLLHDRHRPTPEKQTMDLSSRPGEDRGSVRLSKAGQGHRQDDCRDRENHRRLDQRHTSRSFSP